MLINQITRLLQRRSQPVGPLYVFIRSWNRPLYLWTCLDSLYKYTKYPCKFVLIDNCSTDPMVRQVVRGFQRRDFFHAVHFMDRNHPANQNMVYCKYRDKMGRYLAVLDADITIESQSPCWLNSLVNIAEKHPKLAVIGSRLDQGDFIDPKWAASGDHGIPEPCLSELIKAMSPERQLPDSSQEVISPFSPPGRLLLLRREVIDKVGLSIPIAPVCKAARSLGYRTGIATGVRHRHLSLLNFFDYPDYDLSQLKTYLKG